MEILKARAHHAEILGKLVKGERRGYNGFNFIRNEYSKLGYPNELIELLINSAIKLNNGSAQLEIAESGPDFICRICISGTHGRTPCPDQGITPGIDRYFLIKRNLKIGQKIKFV